LEQEELVEDLAHTIQEPEIINNPEKMKLFCSRLEKAQGEVNALYGRWEYLEAKKQTEL